MNKKKIGKICLLIISLVTIILFKPLLAMANSGGFGNNNSFYPWLRANYPSYLDESYYANQGVYNGYNEFMNYYYGKSWTPDYSCGTDYYSRSMLNQSFWINEGKAAAWYYSPYGVFVNAQARRLRAVGHQDNTMDSLVESSSINFSKNFANGTKPNIFLSRGTLLYGGITGTDWDTNPLPDAKTGVAYINTSGGTFNINNSALLINSTSQITSNINNEISRLGGRNLFVFGGTGVLDMNYAIGNSYNLTRCGGINRYETLKYWQWFYGSGYNPDVNRQQLESLYGNGGTGSGVEQWKINTANTMNFGDGCTYILNNTGTIGSEWNIQTRTPAFVYRKGTGYLIVYYKTGVKGVWQTVGENYRNSFDKPNLLFDSFGFIDDNNNLQTTLYVGQHYRIRTHMINNGYVSTGSNSGIYGLWDVTHSWKSFRWEWAPALNSGGGWWTDTNYTPTALDIGNNIQFSISADNQGNIPESNENDNWASKTVNIVAPNPITGSLSVTKYDYKESNTLYWVRPNSVFGIYTDGYFPSTYGIYPTRTYVLFAKDGIYNGTTSARQYSTTAGKVKYGSEYDNNFNFDLTNTDLAQQFILNGNNYLKATHHLSAKYDNTAYKLYHTTSYVNGSEYNNSYVDSGIWLKVDGIAPDGLVDYTYNQETADMQINVSNILETESGVRRIWAEYTDKNNVSDIKTEDLIKDGEIYGGKINLYNTFSGNADTVNIKVKAIDNVGNERTLSDTDNDVFMINANITRVLEPHDPVFKGGEKGILNIHVNGGVDTIKITFPVELSTLDEMLNTQIALTPKVSDTINYEFYVPIGTKDNNYNVEVKGYKKGKEKNVYPPFTVNGNILNNLRTRIRKGN